MSTIPPAVRRTPASNRRAEAVLARCVAEDHQNDHQRRQPGREGFDRNPLPA